MLKAVVASGKVREAALGRRIAGLEADTASLTAEVAELRLPPPPAARQLPGPTARQPRARPDLMFELVRLRHFAKCQELPVNPGGSLGVFAVTIPVQSLHGTSAEPDRNGPG